MIVGILSDTHGLLSEAVQGALAGVDHIIHAGDIGGARVLDELELIAPVTAVRGNVDTDELEWRLNDMAVVRLGGKRIMVFHKPDAYRGRIPEDVDVVVNGHTHRPRIEYEGSVLYVNPSSAGMRGRDSKGPSIALLDLSAERPVARIVEL